MTLTEFSYYLRKFLPVFVLFSLIFLVFFYAIKIFFVYLEGNRPVVTKINPVFNKITLPSVEGSHNSSGSAFMLDTIEGVPVTSTGSASVYFLPAPEANFGFRENIYLMAKNLGFDTETVKYSLDRTDAEFKDDQRSFTVDIRNYNFSYELDLSKEATISAEVTLPEKQTIESKAVDFFRNMDRYPEELSQGKTNIIYLIYNPDTGEVAVTENANLANMAEVDFYRPDIDSFPVVSPKYFNSQNYVVMLFGKEEHKIIRAQMKFFEKSDSQVGIYPVKTGEEALASLKAGHGIVVTSVSSNPSSVSIKKMFLAYLDPEVYQDYLEPVYVFLGDNDYVAYIPAVTDEYLLEK